MALGTTIEIRVPDKVLDRLGLGAGDLPRRLEEWLCLELYREGRISSGIAAEWLGLRKVDFLRLLGDRGVPYADYPPEELDDELAAGRRAMERAGTRPANRS